MNIKGSQTEKNLMISFAGESQARNRYDYFAKVAKKEKLIKVGNIFEETARQESQHAKMFFKFLVGGEALEITASFPAGVIGSTLENLKAAAMGENEEWTTMYPEFARIAHEEGFDDVAKVFEEIAVAEKHHEARYLAMFQALESGKMFKSEDIVIWKCSNCGYIHEGKEAPAECPACLHAQGYFEVASEEMYANLKI